MLYLNFFTWKLCEVNMTYWENKSTLIMLSHIQYHTNLNLIFQDSIPMSVEPNAEENIPS